MSRPATGPLLASLPALAISGALLLVPFALSAWRSVMPAGHIDLAAYRALADSVFLAVLGRTLLFAGLVTLGCVVLGVPVAYALLRYRRWAQRLMLGTISLSFLVGTLIRSYAWLAVLGARGLINSVLYLLGMAHPLKLAFSFPGMLVASIQVELPLFILPLYGVMRGIDRRLPRAAQSLGADPLTAWCTVFLPLALPGITVSTALVFLTALGFFTIPALLGPPDTYLLSQELEVRINTLGDEAGASARIVVMLGLIVLAAALAGLAYRRLGHGRLGEGARAAAPVGWRLALGAAAERLAGRLARWRWWPVGLYFGVVWALLALPLAMLLPLAFSNDFYLRFPPRGFSLRWPLAYL
ncbi:MAG TPA: ABC transporter permease, partial [Novosphingobium sp.]|nr:ABC transporter permease [Novosphingobium sp.]